MTLTDTDRLFDNLWDKHVPFPFRLNTKLKTEIRFAWNMLMAEMWQQAGSPAGARSLAAFVQVARLMKEAKLIFSNPVDPDELVRAVQSLLERLKLSTEEPHP